MFLKHLTRYAGRWFGFSWKAERPKNVSYDTVVLAATILTQRIFLQLSMLVGDSTTGAGATAGTTIRL